MPPLLSSRGRVPEALRSSKRRSSSRTSCLASGVGRLYLRASRRRASRWPYPRASRSRASWMARRTRLRWRRRISGQRRAGGWLAGVPAAPARLRGARSPTTVDGPGDPLELAGSLSVEQEDPGEVRRDPAGGGPLAGLQHRDELGAHPDLLGDLLLRQPRALGQRGVRRESGSRPAGRCRVHTCQSRMLPRGLLQERSSTGLGSVEYIGDMAASSAERTTPRSEGRRLS